MAACHDLGENERGEKIRVDVYSREVQLTCWDIDEEYGGIGTDIIHLTHDQCRAFAALLREKGIDESPRYEV